MVRVILSPGVSWTPKRPRWRLGAAAFVLASTASAGALGLLLGLAGARTPERLRLALIAVAAAVLLVVGCLEAGGGNPWLPQLNRESPREWLEGHPVRGIVMTGAWLGVAVTTRVGFALVLLVPLAAFFSGSVLFGLAAYGGYGLARGLCAWVITRRAMTEPGGEPETSPFGFSLLTLNTRARRASGFATLFVTTSIVL